MHPIVASGSKTAFGRAVSSARAYRGLSIFALAAKCGMSPGTLSAFETGRRRFEAPAVRRIVDALSATPEETVRIADAWAAEAEGDVDPGYGCTPECAAGHLERTEGDSEAILARSAKLCLAA